MGIPGCPRPRGNTLAEISLFLNIHTTPNGNFCTCPRPDGNTWKMSLLFNIPSIPNGNSWVPKARLEHLGRNIPALQHPLHPRWEFLEVSKARWEHLGTLEDVPALARSLHPKLPRGSMTPAGFSSTPSSPSWSLSRLPRMQTGPDPSPGCRAARWGRALSPERLQGHKGRINQENLINMIVWQKVLRIWKP